MPSFVISGSSSTVQTLNDGETGCIGQNGALYVAGADAIKPRGRPP